MIKIEYNLTSYEDLLRHIGRVMQLKIANDTIVFSPDVGSGSIRLMKLPNGLQVLIYDYCSAQDIIFYRKKTASELYSIRMDDIPGSAAAAAKSSIFFGNTTGEWYHLASANVHQKSINVMMSKDWLQRLLGREESGDTILNFISLKYPAYHYELLDVEYRRLVNEMTEPGITGENSEFENFIVQNRVMLIIERFFTKLCKKINDVYVNLKMSAEEIVRLKLVEQALVNDFSLQPPNINQLSRIAAMSPSKLKTLFKKMYGMPIYQYFQKKRMNKAKAMLLSKKYNLQQVATELGYNNVNDFSKKFKKAFDQLPAEI
ncbi:MAG TPA: AraC family transcriptional regulator [Chitinophagaceae bacterium]|nr:AraC family transcriptional regulator [Chitinophagaceae bacterium]